VLCGIERINKELRSEKTLLVQCFGRGLRVIPASIKGYEIDNIQFVSTAANWAKNKMTHIQMIEFCDIIIAHKQTMGE